MYHAFMSFFTYFIMILDLVETSVLEKKKEGVIRLVPKPVYSKYAPNVLMY